MESFDILIMKLGVPRWKLFYSFSSMVSQYLAENAMFSGGIARILEWGRGTLTIFALKSLAEPKMFSCQALSASFIFAFSSISHILPPPTTHQFFVNPTTVPSPNRGLMAMPKTLIYRFSALFYDFIT